MYFTLILDAAVRSEGRTLTTSPTFQVDENTCMRIGSCKVMGYTVG